MSNSSEKEKWWIYPLLFLTGVLSLPLGLLLIIPFSGILSILERVLCTAGWCGFDTLWAAQFLLPFMMCSFLVSLVLYFFKERSPGFALKTFIISFASLSLLFFGSISFSNLIQLSVPPFFAFVLIPLILFIIGLIAFKQRPLIRFSMKAFAVSIIALFLALNAWILLAASPTYYLDIRKFGTVEEIVAENPNLREVRSAGITAEELGNYPALKNAINGYDINKNEYGSSWSEVGNDEWERTRLFIEQKWREPWYLFSIEDKDMKEELDQMKLYSNRSVPMKLRRTFEENGISLPEDDEIFKLSENRIRTHGFIAYDIRIEGGRLNVYPDRDDYGTAIKFRDEYYMIRFAHGD